jgi:hypothetical protein
MDWIQNNTYGRGDMGGQAHGSSVFSFDIKEKVHKKTGMA